MSCEYDITWLLEDIAEEVKIEKKEGEGKKTDWLQLPVELWLIIFGYVMTPRIVFCTRLLRVCTRWNSILLKYCYTSLIASESRHLWLGDLQQHSSDAVHVLCHGSHAYEEMIYPDNIKCIFRHLLLNLHIRILTNHIYHDQSKNAVIALQKTKRFMHLYYHSCSFSTMSKDIREAGIRRYVRYFLEIVLQDIFRNTLVHLEEEYLLSPYFSGGMLVDTRRHRRPLAERINPIQEFSRYCVHLLETIADNVSPPLINAFARYNYASSDEKSILNHILRIDTDNDVLCRVCQVGEDRRDVNENGTESSDDDDEL